MALQDRPEDLRRFRSAAYQPNRNRPSMDIRRSIEIKPPMSKTLPLPSQQQPTSAPTESVKSARTIPPAARTPLSTPGRQFRAASQSSLPAKKKRKIFTKMRIVGTILILLLVGGGWMATKILSNVAKVFHGNVFSVLTTTKLKGEDAGRVNILVAGNSADDPGHGGADLTDSIMVVSVDTKNNTAFLLSIPRDTWVDIPGYGHAKINETYVDGQAGGFSAPGYPSGGMGLLEEVVHQNFGLKFDYYALVNYAALRDAVNDIGGIDINIQSSDPRGLYDPSTDFATHGPLVKLTNGQHHINGEQALDLARARGDAYGSYGFEQSDFERTQNQRMIVLALKSKILSAGILANPITLSNLFDAIGKNVSTDMTLSEARRLYDISKSINNNTIQSVSLNSANGKNLLANYQAPNGESALIPAAGVDTFTAIQAFIAQLTSNNPVVREGASVVVLNGTNTTGLAAQAQATLVGKGANVTDVGDASAVVSATSIIDVSQGKDPATLQLLKQLYGVNATKTNPYANVYPNATFIVVLGTDHVGATPTASAQ